MEEIMNDGWRTAGSDTERAMAVGLVTSGAVGLVWLVSMAYVIGAWAMAL